jgi:SAM-dependent methyltransferase
MDVTNRFVLDFARRHGGRILDYGCGSGAVVFAGRELGLDFWGADVFYEGAETRRPDSEFIAGIVDGRLPFPDGYFDLVTNNQVMEHVEDLEAVLAEIDRVLKPGGILMSIFPSVDVWREGHIGIPFSHWFRKNSRLRLYYTWALRSLGLGTWKEQAPTTRQWASDKLAWIDRWTRYRTRKEIFRAYERHFTSELIEPEYIRYRLLDRPTPARRLAVPLAGAGTPLFRKLAFLVIRSRKGRA